MSTGFGAGQAFLAATQRALVRLPTFTRSLIWPDLHFTGFFFFFAATAAPSGPVACATGAAVVAKPSTSTTPAMVVRPIRGLDSARGCRR